MTAEPLEATPAARPSPRLLGSIAAFVVVFGIAGTWWLGSAEGWATAPGMRPAAPPVAMADDADQADGATDGEGAAEGGEAAHEASAAEIAGMVDRLEERLKAEPDNLPAWLMLGRSRAVLGQFDQAAAAFRHVLARQPDQAEARDGLAQVQALLAEQGAAQNPAPTGAAAAAATLQGRVELAPALAGQVAPEHTVFVFARAAQGSRMPLAIVRKQVRDLPFDFTLDDSSAMTPQTRLSQATRVVVGARISKTGQATPQPGDFEVMSEPLSPGASGLKLVIAAPVR